MFGGGLQTPTPPWTAWTRDHRLTIARNGGLEELDAQKMTSRTLAGAGTIGAAARKAGLKGFDAGAPVTADARTAVYLVGDRLAAFDLTHKRFTPIDRGEIKDVQLSPNGRLIAYAKDRDLYVADLASGKPHRLTTAGPRQLNGVLTWVYWEEILGRVELAYRWSPDSRRLLYLQTDESPVKESSFIDYRSRPPKVWTQAYPFAGQPNPKVRAGVIAATGGPTAWLKPGTYEYLVRLGWTPEGEPWVLTMNRRQTQTDLWVGERAAHVLTDRNPAWVNLTNDVFFLKGGKGVLMNSQRDGYDRIYRFDRKGRIMNAVTPPRRSIGSTGLWVSEGIRHVDEAAGTVWVQMQEPDWRSVQLYRVRLDGTGYKRLTRATGGHVATVSPDGTAFLDGHSGLNRFPQEELCDAGGKVRKAMTPPFALPSSYAPAEAVAIRARDGYPLSAYVRKPKDFDPSRRYPVVVCVYGGPGLPLTTDAWKGFEEQLFTDAGYVYLVVDPRSATTVDARTPRAVKGHAVGDAELRDVVDAVRWLKGQPYIDPKRFGIWGWSGGGNFALLALTRSDEFAAGMAGAPVTDWKLYDTFYTETLMGLPQENPRGYAVTRRWPDAKNLHGRLLIMHGTHDDNVHPINEETFVKALMDAGKTCEMMVFPMQKHGLDAEAERQMMRTMLDFFRRSL